MSSQWLEDFLLVSLCLKDVLISFGSLVPGTCFKSLGSTSRCFGKEVLTKTHLGSELKHQGTGPQIFKRYLSFEGCANIIGFVITWGML